MRVNSRSAIVALCERLRALHIAPRVYAALVNLAVNSACAEEAAVSPQAGEEPGFTAPQGRPRLALVLSAGGMRGFAHVGVLKVLQAQGIRPDLIVGSSVGALVGAIYASGCDARTIERIVSADGFCLGSGWFCRSANGARLGLHAFVASQVRHQRIEHFPISFAAVATDLQNGSMAIFNHGGAALAVQASTGLPGAFASTMIGGRAFADGGLTSPVPVRAARALGAQHVIAVNLTVPPALSRLDSLVDRMFQVGLVMARSLAVQEACEADVLIEPALQPHDQTRLDTRFALIAAGQEAVLEALPRVRALLAPQAVPSPATAPALPGTGVGCGAATGGALSLSLPFRP